MKIRNFLKKMLAVVLVFAMLAPIMGNLEANVNEVQAEETATSSEMLSVKCQVTNGVVTDTSIDKYRNNYVMRFVSSIDSLEYKEVGFEITYVVDEETGETETKTNSTKTVFNRIESTTGSTENGRDTYSFSPKVISTDSEYFITAKWPVAPADVAENYTVRAFARTASGTEYGPARCVSVNDGLTTCETINMSFKNTKGVDLTGVTALKANDYDAEVIGVDDTTVHVRISGVDKSSLKSATTFTFTTSDGSTVGSGIYRNLYTKYTGNADKTWYEEYLKADSTETKFVIASSADLYGLADLVNTDHVTFEEKEVFVVSDIAVNEEILVTDQTDTTKYKKWYTYDESTDEKNYVDSPTYTWTSIGYRDTSVSSKPYYSFKGTFDAQMHTISGLYNNNMRQYGGFFGPLQSTTTIKNLKLENSYFETATTDCGSITGYGAGTLDTVYSNAIVESESYRVGGLVGAVFVTGFQMKSCWYDGIITNTSQNRGTGGVLGTAYSGSDVTMTECLNTGIVDASTCTNSIPKSGGLIGDIAGTAVMTDCLNTGTVVGTYGAAIAGCVNGGKLTCNTTYGCGSDNVVTYCSTSNFIVNYNCYAGENSSTRNNNNCKSVPVVSLSDRSDNDPYGTGATSELGGFDFDTVWTVVPNETPVLQLFESEIIDTSWYDENQDIYVLYDKADLWGFSALSQTEDFAGKTIKLGNDIVVNTGVATNWATNAPKYEWTPIGNIDLPFAGTFDGDMHTISGLYLNADVTNSGLFSVTGHTSTVKNLELKNSYFTSTGAALGSIAGQGRGLFDTVSSNAIVNSSNARVGGLVGMGYGTDVVMQYCQFSGTVTNTADGKAYRGTGGLMGMLYTDANVKSIAQINNCLNNGTVDAEASTQLVPKVGGLVGGAESGSTLNIADCLNLGDVNVASGNWDGLIVGCIDGASVKCSTSYALGTSGTDFIVGWMQSSNDGIAPHFVIDYISGSTLTPNDERYSSDSDPNSATNGYRKIPIMFLTKDSILGTDAETRLAGFDFESTWSSVTDSTPILNFSEEYQETDTRWYDANATEYVLYDEGDLYGFASLSQSNTFADKTVKLGNDIVAHEGNAKKWAENASIAPSRQWTPIGNSSSRFAGTFDGDMHTISGLYINASSGSVGLFGRIGGGTVRNLKLTNSHFETTGAYCGSIAGWAQNVALSRVYSDASVTCALDSVGGFIGMGSASVDMDECWFAGTVTNASTNEENTGGFVGIQYSGSLDMDNCLNTGSIDVSSYTETDLPMVGGFVGTVGYKSGTTYYGANIEIAYCLNTGTLNIADGKRNGAFTGYMHPNSTLEITYTYADNSKWKSMGTYYLSQGTTVNGSNDSSTVSEMASRIFVAQDKVSGTEAMSYLAGFHDNVWTISADGTVVLKAFVDEVTDTAVSELHQKISSNPSLSTAMTLSCKLPLPTDSTNQYSQGGCYAEVDGKQYYYQAFITEKVSGEVDNKVRILKYDLANQTATWSEDLALNHANDMTYNSKLDCLVICHNAGGANYVSYVDPENLTLIDADTTTEEIDRVDIGFYIYSIDYNALTNRYVVGVSDGKGFCVLNSKFEKVHDFALAEGTEPVKNDDGTQYIENIPQGICCDENYIYAVLYTPNVIVVYDWFGNCVSQIEFTLDSDAVLTMPEPENISVVGDTIYVTAYTAGVLSSQTEVYVTDASNLATAE